MAKYCLTFQNSTNAKAINDGSKEPNERKQVSEDKSIRPHCKVSIEDINWVRQQPPCVQQLWLDSIAPEQFGGSAHKLDTNLTYKSLQKAGAALSAQGLFQFEEVFGRLPSGRPGLISYRVRNLHGYYDRFYWESSTSAETSDWYTCSFSQNPLAKRGVSQEIQFFEFKVRLKRNALSILLSRRSQNQHLINKKQRKFS